MTSLTTLRLCTYNLHEGGFDNGRDDRRLQQLALLRDLQADLILIQELHHWDQHGFEPFHQAESILGMRGLMSLAPMVQCHLGVFLNPERIRPLRWDSRYSSLVWHAYAQARLQIEALEEPLEVASVHLSPWSPEHRLEESALVAQNIGKAGLGIAAGDFNSVPPADPEPSWDQLPVYKRSQAIVDGEVMRADRRVGERLARAGLVDAAHGYAQRLGAATAPTGTAYRCDQIWLTPRLAEGVQLVETIDTGLSDHRLLYADVVVT